jgi:transcriptional regulator with XRE-family HTH domain
MTMNGANVRDATRKAVGAQVRAARRAARLNQAQLSALSGIGINTITRCERGSIGVTLDTLARLAEVLKVDIAIPADPSRDAAPPDDRPAAPGGYDLGDD